MKSFIFFISGVVLGGVVSWKLANDYLRQGYNDALNELRENNTAKNKQTSCDEKKSDNQTNNVNKSKLSKEDIKKNMEIIDYCQYSGTPDEITVSANNDQSIISDAYIIPEEDFGENGDDYDLHTLLYFVDRVLTDDNNDIISNPEEVIGEDALAELNNMFANANEYSIDCLYVRNDRLCVEYEILLDERTYDSLNGGKNV